MNKPSVSVVIPCRNEEHFIARVLENLVDQYDNQSYEIVIADGLSTDGTRGAIEKFISRYPASQIRLIENEKINIPAGLNVAIREARGDIIVRMDGHSFPSSNYVQQCIDTMEETQAEVVGMPWRISPGAETVTAHAIARSVGHSFGAGDAKYRLRGESGGKYVDTVPFGVFKKSLWQELGGFNEMLLTNEDYEFFYRIRRRNGRIYLGKGAYCSYVARTTLKDLADQYFRYGIWKVKMLKLNPYSIRLRQIVPPGFVLVLLMLGIAGLFLPIARLMFLLIGGFYTLVASYFSTKLAIEERSLRSFPAILSAFFVMHFAWGSGFWLGLVGSQKHAPKGERKRSTSVRTHPSLPLT